LLDYIELDEKLKNNKFENCYIFCGADEALMKEKITYIKNKILNTSFMDLNFVQFDGKAVDMEVVINTSNTIPFMDKKKVVVVYRAEFLGEGEDKSFNKSYEELQKYLDNPAEYTILIVYYVFKEDREKPSNRIKKLDKKACTVKFDKLKGMNLERKIKTLFDEKGKNIGKIELRLFCEGIENNMEVAKNEVEKLCCFAINKEITREDILTMLPPKADNDIFDLVDCISQKKLEKALEILNELLFKGEKLTYILYMIERQFNLLLQLKLGTLQGKSKDLLVKELKMNPYICEKMIIQSKRFTLKSLKEAIYNSLKSEELLKSSQVNSKTEIELLLLKTITA
jgi:DNA polymerase III subunit delta